MVKTTALLLWAVGLLFPATVEANEPIATSAQTRRTTGNYIFVATSFGTSHMRGALADQLKNGGGLALSTGTRQGSFMLEFRYRFQPNQQLTAQYVTATGYPSSVLQLNWSSYAVQAGYSVFEKRGMRLTPYGGLAWTYLSEDASPYDLHPAFDLDAHTGAQLFGGFRLTFRIAEGDLRSGVYRHHHYTFIEFRLARVRFNNREFENGSSLEVSMGYLFDRGVF